MDQKGHRPLKLTGKVLLAISCVLGSLASGFLFSFASEYLRVDSSDLGAEFIIAAIWSLIASFTIANKLRQRILMFSGFMIVNTAASAYGILMYIGEGF